MYAPAKRSSRDNIGCRRDRIRRSWTDSEREARRHIASRLQQSLLDMLSGTREMHRHDKRSSYQSTRLDRRTAWRAPLGFQCRLVPSDYHEAN